LAARKKNKAAASERGRSGKASRRSKARKRAARKSSAGRARGGGLWTTARVLAVVAAVAGFWASSWILEQDQIVRARFEGRRFSVPSRVLSAPIVLYPGLDWKRVELPQTLDSTCARSSIRRGASPAATSGSASRGT